MRRALTGALLAAALTTSSCHIYRADPMVEQKYRKIMQARSDSREFFSELKKREDNEHADFMRAMGEPQKKPEPLRRFPCEEGMVLPGGLDTHAFVLLQEHRDSMSGRISPGAVKSRLLIFRILQRLAKRYGIGIVFLEGSPLGRQKETDGAAAASRKSFERCKQEIASKLDESGAEPAGQNEIEDLCVLDFLAKERDDDPIRMLESLVPSVSVVGFERETRRYEEMGGAMEDLSRHEKRLDEKDGKYKLRWTSTHWTFQELEGPDYPGIKRLLEANDGESGYTIVDALLDFKYAHVVKREVAMRIFAVLAEGHPKKDELVGLAMKHFDFAKRYGEFAVKTRSRHAVEGIASNPSMNSAVVIGKGHFGSMVTALLYVSHDASPTVHFIEPECADRDALATPRERMLRIVNALVE